MRSWSRMSSADVAARVRAEQRSADVRDLRRDERAQLRRSRSRRVADELDASRHGAGCPCRSRSVRDRSGRRSRSCSAAARSRCVRASRSRARRSSPASGDSRSDSSRRVRGLDVVGAAGRVERQLLAQVALAEHVPIVPTNSTSTPPPRVDRDDRVHRRVVRSIVELGSLASNADARIAGVLQRLATVLMSAW